MSHIDIICNILHDDLRISPLDLTFLNSCVIDDRIEVLEPQDISINKTFEVSVIGDNITFSINSNNITIPSYDLKRLPHDLVCRMIGMRTTDQELKLINHADDSCDNVTPDLIYQKSLNSYIVLEIKTTRNDKITQNLCSDAILKYRNPVLARNNDKTIAHLSSMAVSKRTISTNLHNLPLEAANVCCLTLKFAHAMQDAARYHGWKTLEDDKNEGSRNALLNTLKLFSLPETADQHEISVEKLKHWDNLQSSVKSMLEVFKDVESSNSPTKTEAKFFINSWQSSPMNSRLDVPPIFQMPFCLATHDTRSDESKSLDYRYNLRSHDTALGRLWLNGLRLTKFQTAEEKASSDKKMMLEAEESRVADKQTNRKLRNRFKSDLTRCDYELLALDGIEAKQRKVKTQAIKEKKIRSKKSFSWQTDVSDINHFILGSDDLLSEMTDYKMESSHDLSILADVIRGDADSCFTSIPSNFYWRFCRTKLAGILHFLDLIIQEVNISRSQNCSKGEFIMKSMQQHNCLLLIKPTSASNHIFFSLLFKPEMEVKSSIFRNARRYGDYLMTDFISLNQHRISHYLYLREKMCLQLSMWMTLFQIPIETDFNSLPVEVSAHFKASMLFWLEAKEHTSKEAQLIRFAYMEVVKEDRVFQDPLKILSKWDLFSRSRLNLWMKKMIIKAFDKMNSSDIQIKHESKKEQSKFADEPTDLVTGLLSWVTLEPIPNYEIALNLSYFGVLHNKEESVETHSCLKMFSKVIKEELLMKDVRPLNLGFESPSMSELRPHEFNASFALAIGDAIKQMLINKVGDIGAWFKTHVSDRINSRTLESLATMKKSASGDLTSKIYKKGMKCNQRITCMEAALNLTNRGFPNEIMQYSGLLFREIKSEYNGVVANLFRKLQIGGVREIFVLEFRCRILIHFLETISRVIGEQLDNEMLTKGDKKLSRSDDHFKIIRKREFRSHTTAISSDDATTWAQRFTMPLFGCVLSRVLPEPFRTPCLAIMNLVANKSLELPATLLELFENNPEISSFDDSLNQLKMQYLGKTSRNDLVEPRGRFLKNKSNMMQGILHYTSSIIHAGYLKLWSSLSKKICKSKINPELRMMITTKVSSDDSSVIITREFSDDFRKRGLDKHVLRSLLRWKANCYPLFSALQSEHKSTVACFSLIEEFNSLWYYRNTLLSPVIKFVSVAVRTHPSSRYDDRFHLMSNLRSSLMENSGAIALSAIAQECQLSAHYSSMGAYTNSLWPNFKLLLMSKPHPCFGFFVKDLPALSGVLSQDFNIYSCCLNNEIFRNLHCTLFSTGIGDFSETGAPTIKTYLGFGQSRIYNNLRVRAGVTNEEVRDFYNGQPALLYQHPTTIQETSMNLKLKLLNPALAESLSFLTDAKLHASSVYSLQNNVTLVSINFEETRKLVSLISLIKSFKTLKPNFDYQLLFPNNNIYSQVLNKFKNSKNFTYSAAPLRRKTYTKVIVPRSTIHEGVKLLDVVKRKWFKMDVQGAEFTHEHAWKRYKEAVPWLNDDVSETLEKSPFNDHITLRNFLYSFEKKPKTIRIISSSRKQSTMIETISNIVEMSQWPNTRLREINSLSEGTQLHFQELMTKLWRLREAPPIYTKSRAFHDIMSEYVNEHGIQKVDPTKQTRAEMSLAICCNVWHGLNFNVIKEQLGFARLGVIGVFEQRQVHVIGTDTYRGDGIFTGELHGCPFSMIIKGKFLNQIIVRNLEALNNCNNTIKQLMKEFKLELQDCSTGNRFWDLNKNIMYHTSKNGRLSVKISSINDVPINQELAVSFDWDGRVRIRSTNVNRTYTVLSLTPKGRNITAAGELSEGSVENYIVDRWISGRSIGRNRAVELISVDDNELESWILETLKNRLYSLGHMNMRGELKFIEYQQTMTESEHNETYHMDQELSLNFIEDISKTLEEYFIDCFDDEINSEEESLSELFHMPVFNEEESGIFDRLELESTIYDTSTLSLPFWDDLIIDLWQTVPKNLWLKLNTAYSTRFLRELITISNSMRDVENLFN